MATPGVPASAVVVAGSVLIGAAWSASPGNPTSTWWTSPMQSADALRVAVACLLAVAPVALVMLRARGVARDARPDGSLSFDSSDELEREASRSILPRFGLVLMGLGVAVSIGGFLSVQSGQPPTRASLPVGKAIEFVEGAMLGRPVRLMLPRRVEATRLEMGERGALMGVRFSTPGEDPTDEQELTVGESVVLDGLRLTFVGTREDSSTLRAVVSGVGENVIQAAAGEGETFKVTLDGPTYTLQKMTLNHLGVMGPAISVSDEEGDLFWVYSRRAQERLAPAFETPLRLDRFETRRVPVVSVAPAREAWPPMAAGALFVAGLGLFLMFAEVAPRRGRGFSFSSLNAAGFSLAPTRFESEDEPHDDASEEE